MNRFLIAIAIMFFCARLAIADIVTMKSGREIECLVLQKTDTEVLVRMQYGTMGIPIDQIEKIDTKPLPGISTKEARSRLAARAATNPSILVSRIPPWSECVDALAKEPWATGLIQIPATVVTNGSLRFVPYLSHRCGADYEMNVYGDPDAPAGVEIGVRGDLLKSVEAKQNCIKYIASILPRPEDSQIVKTIGIDKKLVVSDGLTIEITPPTDPDAYGGWWISVYSTDLLDKSRATDEELKYITISKASLAAAEKKKRDEAARNQAYADAFPTTQPQWDSSDLDASRGGNGGGDVYVHGYYRANATYVSPYTRAAPGYGTGRGSGGRGGGGGHR